MEFDRRRGAPPVYAQVADLLRARIADRRLAPGDRIESEPELKVELGVSRGTVAKALEQLLQAGVVVREQGRGTFIASQRLERRLPELTGFTEHIRSLGHRPGQRLLTYESMPASSHDTLGAVFTEGEPLVVIRRLRLVDGRPAGIHRTALPAELARRVGFTEGRLRNRAMSLYRLLDRHGTPLATAEERITAHNANPEEAALLEVEPGAALIHVLRVSRDRGGRLVEAVDARYLGSRYDYRIDLIRPNKKTRP